LTPTKSKLDASPVAKSVTVKPVTSPVHTKEDDRRLQLLEKQLDTAKEEAERVVEEMRLKIEGLEEEIKKQKVEAEEQGKVRSESILPRFS